MRRMWSKGQIKSQISGASAEVVQALQGQDVKVKTIEQSEANWEINDIFDSISVDEGLVYTKIYARFEEINGILYIVHIFDVENTTESSINFAFNKNIVLPEEIAKKIYDVSGKNVHELSPDNITTSYAMYGSGSELISTRAFSLRNRNFENTMNYLSASATPIPANTTIHFTFREFLTLK